MQAKQINPIRRNGACCLVNYKVGTHLFENQGITVLVFFMNNLTENKTQVMCPGCGQGHIWLRYLHPNPKF